MSLILKEVKEKAGITKPLWIFILSWEKGWQHGQDAVMFTDAGADFLMVMLYECDREQFDNLIRQWESYIEEGQVSILSGDETDWPLHQYTHDPSGPKELYNRTIQGYKTIGSKGPVKGMFVHDLGRSLWRGRRGPYPGKEWLVAGAHAFSDMRKDTGQSAINADVSWEDSGESRKEGYLIIQNLYESDITGIHIEVVPFTDVAVMWGEDFSGVVEKNKTVRIPFSLRAPIPPRYPGTSFAFRIVWDGAQYPCFYYVSIASAKDAQAQSEFIRELEDEEDEHIHR